MKCGASGSARSIRCGSAMPLRLIVAYALIVLLAAAVGAAYLYFTRDRRAYRRAERAYNRARKASRRRA